METPTKETTFQGPEGMRFTIPYAFDTDDELIEFLENSDRVITFKKIGEDMKQLKAYLSQGQNDTV